MAKNIYIHIGHGKTGTSSIQFMLFNNRDSLLKSGVLYPESGLDGDGHKDLAELSENSFNVRTSQLYENLIKEIDKSNCEKIIISSEYFCYCQDNYIKEVQDFLKDFNIKIIYYVREQSKLIVSTYLQFIKTGKHSIESCENFYRTNKEAFDFMIRISPWVKYFGEQNIYARLFDKNIIGNDVCNDFCRLVDIQQKMGIDKNIEQNKSIIPEFAEIINLIDKTTILAEERKKIIDGFLNLSTLFKDKSKKKLLETSTKEKMKEHYLDSNKEFARKFLSKNEGNLLCK